jgi:hypothetical protein
MLLKLRALLILNLALFTLVLAALYSGSIAYFPGLTLLISWIIVFFASIAALTAHMSRDGEEWYHYGIMLSSGALMAMIAGIVLGLDIYGIAILMPFTVMGSLSLNWMFSDRSEAAIDEDLKRLRSEIRD